MEQWNAYLSTCCESYSYIYIYILTTKGIQATENGRPNQIADFYCKVFDSLS